MALKHNLSVEIKTTVRYAETDQMKVVYHANYFVWFNMARDALAKKLGIDIEEGEKKGYLMPLFEVSCKYYYSVRYGDEVIIRAIPESTTVAKFIVYYKVIHSKTRRLLAEGKTTSVLMTKNGRLLLRVPEEYKDVMSQLL